MMMPDNLKTRFRNVGAMSVVKHKFLALPRLDQRNMSQVAVVVSDDENDGAKISEPIKQRGQLFSPGPIVHKIAEQDQMVGSVVA